MSCILNIETTTDICSVALSKDGEIIYKEEDDNGPQHAKVLADFVKKTVSFADNHAILLDAVALSEGPGSYTGLRIGTSIAKGLCYGRNLKLINISTLELLCVPVLLYHEELEDEALLCPMLDARRMEVYNALYTKALNIEKNVFANIIDENSFLDILDKQPIYFFGNGSDKCRNVITHSNAHFIEGIKPIAKNMIVLAEKAMAQNKFADVAYFEPFYLKEFITTQSKKLL